MTRSIILVTIFLFTVHYSRAQSARQILEKYFELVGGVDKIAAIKALSYDFQIINYTGKKDTTQSSYLGKEPYSSLLKDYNRKGYVTLEYFQHERGGLWRFHEPYPMEKIVERKPTTLTVSHLLLRAYNENRMKASAPMTIEGEQCLSVETNF